MMTGESVEEFLIMIKFIFLYTMFRKHVYLPHNRKLFKILNYLNILTYKDLVKSFCFYQYIYFVINYLNWQKI